MTGGAGRVVGRLGAPSKVEGAEPRNLVHRLDSVARKPAAAPAKPAPPRQVAGPRQAPPPAKPHPQPQPRRARPQADIIIEVASPETLRRLRGVDRRRSAMLWLSFLALVVAPTALCAWYLFEKAADQYVSYVSFAVRSPESSTASPMLEMLGGGSDTTRGDSQILYEYLQSQPLVERVNDRLDLRTIYNDPRADPVFRLGPDPSVEALVEYWNLAQTVSYDSSAGIIYAEIRAFDPDDAQRIAAALVEESEALINDLSAKSRRDAIAFALTDLQGAEARVRKVRLALQDFRGAAGTADVALDIQSAMGLVSGLRAKRAALAAEYDSKKDMLGAQSPILLALGRQLAAVDDQIAQEESRVASAGSDGSAETGSLADAAGRQEELMVERQFAENMYTAALTAVESARAEARRAQRYLAIHIRPTRSDDAEHPRRWTLSLAIGLTALVLWSILQLIGSSIRDRS
ncbi:MAG: capsular polysaccharide transport system permease protein [Paracoccaceae bacterium]|jgi:capsular polysaccharide transport system permease protein